MTINNTSDDIEVRFDTKVKTSSFYNGGVSGLILDQLIQQAPFQRLSILKFLKSIFCEFCGEYRNSVICPCREDGTVC